MARSRLQYLEAADRWEAVPIDEMIIEVIEAETHVRLFIGDRGVNGFAIDVDGDLESRLDVLARYVVMDGMRSRFESGMTGVDGVEIEIVDRTQLVHSRTLATVGTRAVGAPQRASSLVHVTMRGDQVSVAIAARWWLWMWGMWFTLKRSDGLVLSDLPVRRTPREEVVPNSVPIRPDGLRGELHRGPHTIRRIVISVLLVIGVFVSLLAVTRSTGQKASSVAIPTSVSPATTSVSTSVGTTTTPTVTSIIPAIEVRRPATQWVSTDKMVGLDIVAAGDVVVPAGTGLPLEFRFERAAINRWGSPDGGIDQSTLKTSCDMQIGSFRPTSTPQPGHEETFTVFAESVADGSSRMLDPLVIGVDLEGATIEGCPDAIAGSTDQYYVLQRTYYVPANVTVVLPADLNPGDYLLRFVVNGVTWAGSPGLSIRVEG